MIKMIALDLDGTTLNSQGKLPPVVRTALEDAIAADIEVIVATGRVFSAIPKEILEVKGIRYTCSSNGARVIDLATNKVIYKNFIAPKAVEDMSVILGRYNFMYEVFTDGKAYVEKVLYDRIAEMRLSDRHVTYVLNTRQPVEGVLDYMLKKKRSIENININFQDQENRLMMKEILSEHRNITLTSSFDHNLEIGGKTTSKADAITKMAEMMGIKREEIMAAGDNPNDKAMLEASGLPVAVGNAKDEIKAVAKYITTSNDEGGVAKAIYELVLNRKSE
mgnify:FL=1